MTDKYSAAGSAWTLGLGVPLCVVFGFAGGHWLDHRFGTDPWLTIIGFVYGCAAAGKTIHTTWKEMQEATKRMDREQRSTRPVYEKPGENDP